MAGELVRNGVSPDRVTVAPLFPPASRVDPEPPTTKPRSDRILFIGRITALKGWRELLDALPRAAAALGRRLTLVVAGDGPDRGAFEAEARRRNMPAEFLGWLGADQLDAEMRSADVLAVPSVWPEPFGLVGLEAGCVGLPAVAFAVGGISGWLVPGMSGELAAGARPELARSRRRAGARAGRRRAVAAVAGWSVGDHPAVNTGNAPRPGVARARSSEPRCVTARGSRQGTCATDLLGRSPSSRLPARGRPPRTRGTKCL